MKFSGVLRDVTGKPMNGAVEVTFALYGAEAGGDPLWFETQSVSLDEQGRYTVLLGAMHDDGLPMGLFTSGEVRWLGVKVGHEPEQLPRILLVSVPYALKAGDAETLGGKPASAFVQTGVESEPSGGTAVSGAGAGPAPKTGATKNTKTSSPAVAGTGSVNYLAKWTDTSGDLGNSLLFDNGTNVGIGTASPNYPFEVHSSTGNSLLGITAPAGSYAFFRLYSGGNAWDFRTNSAAQAGIGGAGDFSLGQYGGPSSLLIQSGTGNVGIGTPTPAATLDVNGTANFSGPAAATAFWGDGTNLTNVNAAKLGGMLPAAFQLAGSYAVTSGTNSFGGTQTLSTGDVSITSGNLDLPATNGTGTAGVIKLGGTPFASGFGTGNTFIGQNAGNFTTTGGGNTANGTGALRSNTSGLSNIAIAAYALDSNTKGGTNTAIGAEALYSNTTGGNNTTVGYAAGWNGVSSSLPANGSNSTFLGASATATVDNLYNATAIGSYTTVSASKALVLGSTGDQNGVATTKVGIDVGNPSDILTVMNGGGHAISDGWDTYSSRRWKSDIQPLQLALGKVEPLRGVSYSHTASGKHDIGMIAEEVGKVVPEVVSYEDNGKDARGIDYARLTALLVEAVKQQQAEIAKLQSQIAEKRKERLAQRAELSQVLAQVRVIQAKLGSESATRPRIRAAENRATTPKAPKAPPSNARDAGNQLVATEARRGTP